MVTAKDNHNKRLLGVQKLLSDCCKRIDALCRLYESLLQQAKANKGTMLEVYDNAYNLHNELKLNSSGSKLVRKTLVSKIKECATEFGVLYEQTSTIFNESEPTRKEYKSDVKDCIDAHKSIREKNGIELSKGYKNLVNMIRKIFDRISDIREEHKQKIMQFLNELKEKMNTLTNGANLIASSI